MIISKSISRVLSWIVIYLVHILLYVSSHQIKKMTSSLSLLFSVLLQMGFTYAQCVTILAVSSYLTFSPLPNTIWRLFSVALSLRFPLLDVIQHHCSSGARTFLVRCLSTLLYATIQFTLMTILKHSSIFVKKSSVLCCLSFLFMELLSLDIGTKLNITKK